MRYLNHVNKQNFLFKWIDVFSYEDNSFPVYVLQISCGLSKNNN